MLKSEIAHNAPNLRFKTRYVEDIKLHHPDGKEHFRISHKPNPGISGGSIT
jgi:hypothetical protein